MQHQAYDSDLQMYCEQVRTPDMSKLRFLRWLAEQGTFDRLPFSAPTGEFAATARLVPTRIGRGVEAKR